jgi:hypothetical protein
MDFSAQHFTHLADLAWIWAAQFLPRLGAAMLILGLGFVAARCRRSRPGAAEVARGRSKDPEHAARSASRDVPRQGRRWRNGAHSQGLDGTTGRRRSRACDRRGNQARAGSAGRQNCADSDRTPNAAGQRSVSISRRPRPSSRRMSSFSQLAHFLCVEEWRLNR